MRSDDVKKGTEVSFEAGVFCGVSLNLSKVTVSGMCLKLAFLQVITAIHLNIKFSFSSALVQATNE